MQSHYLLIISFGIITFLLAWFVIPKFIDFFHERGFVGKDMNKMRKPTVAEMGGVPVIVALIPCYLVLGLLLTFFTSFDISSQLVPAQTPIG